MTNRHPTVPCRPFDTFHRHGRYFGYPDCCIDAFTRFEHLGQPKRKLHGTGFVPCLVCEESKTIDQLKEEIERNRLCPIPFPDAPCR